MFFLYVLSLIHTNKAIMVPISSFSGWNGFVYVLRGQGKFGGPEQWTESTAHHILVLGPGDHIQIKNEVSSPLTRGSG